jgi:hypothetical protein
VIKELLKIVSSLVVNEGRIRASVPSPIPAPLQIQEFDYSAPCGSPSAFFFPGEPPQSSAIEPDWSIKNKKHAGLALLISALYGINSSANGGFHASNRSIESESSNSASCDFLTALLRVIGESVKPELRSITQV